MSIFHYNILCTEWLRLSQRHGVKAGDSMWTSCAACFVTSRPAVARQQATVLRAQQRAFWCQLRSTDTATQRSQKLDI